MHAAITPDDVALLRTHGLSEEDVAHSQKVAEIALALAAELPQAVRAGLDLELVARGALLHDLGKGRDKSLGHGEAGYQLALELGLPAEVAAVMDRHVLGGLPAVEASAMGLPPRDRALARLEEKLVVYADKLADILEETDHAADMADARARYAAILRADPALSKHNAQAMERYVRAGLEVERLIAGSSA